MEGQPVPTTEEMKELLSGGGGVTMAVAAPTVYQRLIAILGELPALGKDETNPQQGFKFRSQDQILNALNPLLAKHGVVIIPTVLERLTSTRPMSNNRVMYEVNLHVAFYFYGSDGSYAMASTWGEGTDMGDKATNKAMTMAFKYALQQVFAISTEETIDADGETVEETYQEQAGRFVPATSWPELLERLGHIMGAMEDAPAWLREAIAARFDGKDTASLMREEKIIALRSANLVLQDLEDEFAGRVDTPSRDRIATSFAKHWEGIALHGPEWRISPDDPAGLPTYEEVMSERAAQEDPGEPEAPQDDPPVDAA